MNTDINENDTINQEDMGLLSAIALRLNPFYWNAVMKAFFLGEKIPENYVTIAKRNAVIGGVLGAIAAGIIIL